MEQRSSGLHGGHGGSPQPRSATSIAALHVPGLEAAVDPGVDLKVSAERDLLFFFSDRSFLSKKRNELLLDGSARLAISLGVDGPLRQCPGHVLAEGRPTGDDTRKRPTLANPVLANPFLAKSNFGQSISGSGVCHGPKGGAQTQKNRAPKGSRVGSPKFRAFFSVSHHQFRSFSLSLSVFSWFFGGVCEDRGRQMCTFGVLGFVHQNSTRRPQEREERMNIVGRDGKNRKILGGPGERGPAEGGPAQGVSGGRKEKNLSI